ncbi:MAG TPA: hypothetical protein VMH28_32190 [Candidatus Acidoferrales bacterium]|nr:hypothetical protein [Candidatus Acidoferrales bacterium]
MNLLIVPLALLCGLALAGTTLSLFALWRVHGLVREVRQHTQAAPDHGGGENRQLREALESLSARLREIERAPLPAGVPGLPRPGMNLTKRSQALRLHRQGETSEQIAAALELPRQEVELLLKVHRIVIANV